MIIPIDHDYRISSDRVTENMLTDRLPEVEKRIGLKRASIYNLMSCGEFPKQTPISKRAVAWSSSAIQSWVDGRIKAGLTARK